MKEEKKTPEEVIEILLDIFTKADYHVTFGDVSIDLDDKSFWIRGNPLSTDSVSKVSALIGYLEYFLSKRTAIENQSDEIQEVIKEANEWLEEEKAKLNL